MPTGRQAVRLFQFRGITVYLHWTWFFVAVFEIGRAGHYSSIIWNVVEYVALFGIVTLHEFGHAFACRGVGGRANEIVLWPLGGVAYVDPPQRPGAVLWSIAAGPLVNVALVPVLFLLQLLASGSFPPDAQSLAGNLAYINAVLLVFNLLPIYPLDGGQILGALLWFVLGRARSLMVAAVVGLIGLAGVGWVGLRSSSSWLLLMTLFLGMRCVGTFRMARAMGRVANALRRLEFACPSCHANPPEGPFWACAACGAAYDLFEARPRPGTAATTTLSLSPADRSRGLAPCPFCGEEPLALKCGQCGATGLIDGWRAPAPGELAQAGAFQGRPEGPHYTAERAL